MNTNFLVYHLKLHIAVFGLPNHQQEHNVNPTFVNTSDVNAAIHFGFANNILVYLDTDVRHKCEACLNKVKTDHVIGSHETDLRIR